MGYEDCSRPRVTHSTVRNARVLLSRGATPVKSGASCTFRLEPAEGEPYNCRIEVRCDGHVLYGAKSTSGFAHCQVDAGVATGAQESEPGDSDPDIDYDAAARRVIVKERTWQVELVIE